MNKMYKLSFNEIVANIYKYKLNTIIESQRGDIYQLVQITNEKRKFTRMLGTKTRFMTYENVKVNFRIVDVDKELDEENNKEIEKLRTWYSCNFNKFIDTNFENIFNKINEIIDKINNKEYCQNCEDELTDKNKYNDNICMECKCGIDWEDK